ncbi:hypothetical protein NKI44_13990 [Mesorhizobium sp. M0614]|uniref:hypothetical protein n=1 Tax=Mesorhizobium sp. M0614 TaxID=2956970 RepID=UPI003336D0FC
MSVYGKWSNPGVPHKGWTFVYEEDLESERMICEMCETEEIRFVHHMEHPNYKGDLRAGCICAGKMEENLEASGRRDREMRNRAARKRIFPSLKGWRVNERGNHILRRDGCRITAFLKEGSWSGCVENLTTKEKIWSNLPYSTPYEFKVAAFAVFEKLARH